VYGRAVVGWCCVKGTCFSAVAFHTHTKLICSILRFHNKRFAFIISVLFCQADFASFFFARSRGLISKVESKSNSQYLLHANKRKKTKDFMLQKCVLV
jgi:hypothetical protein